MDLQNGHLSEIEVVNNDIFVTSTSIIYFQGCCGSDHILHFIGYLKISCLHFVMKLCNKVKVMVFNATFNNISII
jgi:hypothetical protein